MTEREETARFARVSLRLTLYCLQQLLLPLLLPTTYNCYCHYCYMQCYCHNCYCLQQLLLPLLLVLLPLLATAYNLQWPGFPRSLLLKHNLSALT